MLHCTPELSQSLGAVSPFRSFVVTLSAWVSHVMLHVCRYIAFVVDGSESELGILDLIQVFVESLDKSFQNVCELHLIFHSDQVRLQTCWYPSLVWSFHCPFCSMWDIFTGTLYFGWNSYGYAPLRSYFKMYLQFQKSCFVLLVSLFSPKSCKKNINWLFVVWPQVEWW